MVTCLPNAPLEPYMYKYIYIYIYISHGRLVPLLTVAKKPEPLTKAHDATALLNRMCLPRKKRAKNLCHFRSDIITARNIEVPKKKIGLLLLACTGGYKSHLPSFGCFLL